MTGEKKEGTFRLPDGDTPRWFRVDQTRYPRKRWWITELRETHGGPNQPFLHLARDTRQELSDGVWARLEMWL